MLLPCPFLAWANAKQDARFIPEGLKGTKNKKERKTEPWIYYGICMLLHVGWCLFAYITVLITVMDERRKLFSSIPRLPDITHTEARGEGEGEGEETRRGKTRRGMMVFSFALSLSPPLWTTEEKRGGSKGGMPENTKTKGVSRVHMSVLLAKGVPSSTEQTQKTTASRRFVLRHRA